MKRNFRFSRTVAFILFFGGAGPVVAQTPAPPSAAVSEVRVSPEREAARLFNLGRYDAVDAVVARGLAANPDDVELHVIAARTRLMRTSSVEPIVEDWRALAAREPRNATPVIVLVRLGVQEGYWRNPPEFERLASRAVELAPDSAWAWYARALVLIGQDGRADDLLDAFRRANGLDPGNRLVALEYSRILKDLKEFDPAIEVLRKALTANPADGELQTALWETRLEQSPTARATVEAEVRAVLDAAPSDADLLNQTANFIGNSLKDEARAKAIYAEVRRLEPDFGKGNRRNRFSSWGDGILRQYFFAGARYDQLVAFNKAGKTGTPAEVLAAIDGFIRALPKGDPFAEYYVVRLYGAALKADDLSRAEKVAETLVGYDARYAVLFSELAARRLKVGREPERAFELARRAEAGTRTFTYVPPPMGFDTFTEKPQREFWEMTRGKVLWVLGDAALRNNDLKTAREALREAVGIRATSENCFLYGQVLEKAGDLRPAAEAYADAVACAGPEAKDAETRLKAIAVNVRPRLALQRVTAAAAVRKRERLRREVSGEMVSEPFAPFTLRTLDGKRTLTLADLRGKVVFINIWSTSCSFCRLEFPHLIELQRKYGPRGFVLVSLATDADPALAARFLAVRQLPFTGYDGRQLAASHNVGGLPMNYVLDRNGRLRARFHGYKEGIEDHFAAAVEELLDEPANR